MMAPSACHLLQRLLFIIPIFSVTLTAPCIEAAFEVLPLANENLQTSTKSSPVYSSQSDAETATSGTATIPTRAQGAPIHPPRFPLTYDGLLRRRRNAPQDTQYPYDEAPGHPRAPSGRRPLHTHGDFPPDASHEVVHGTRNTERKCHDCTRKCLMRKQLRFHAIIPIRSAPPCEAHHGMRRGYDCKPARLEQEEDVPSKTNRVVVHMNVACNQRAFRKRIGHGSYMKCREHHGSDAVYLFQNSPDTQRAFGLSNQHQDVASDRDYQHPENSYNVRDDYHVHKIQRDHVLKKVYIPFREKGMGEYSFPPDGRRDQFPDISSNNVYNPDIHHDLDNHALHKSYKLSKHPKEYKSHNHKSFSFRDVLFGPGSLYSRLFRRGRSNQRILRRSMHSKGHSSHIHHGQVFQQDHIFAQLFHHILHNHRPCMQHDFRGVTRDASSSEHEMASSSSVSTSSVSPSSVSPSSVSPSSNSPLSSVVPSSAESTL